MAPPKKMSGACRAGGAPWPGFYAFSVTAGPWRTQVIKIVTNTSIGDLQVF